MLGCFGAKWQVRKRFLEMFYNNHTINHQLLPWSATAQQMNTSKCPNKYCSKVNPVQTGRLFTLVLINNCQHNEVSREQIQWLRLWNTVAEPKSILSKVAAYLLVHQCSLITTNIMRYPMSNTNRGLWNCQQSGLHNAINRITGT